MFDPTQFISHAKQLLVIGDEASYRAINIHCYYAVMLYIRDKERGKRATAFSNPNKVHIDINSFVGRKCSRTDSDQYKKLRKRRRQSSYDTDRKVQKNQAHSSIMIAEDLIKTLATLL
jgi:hypothetical protein